MDRPAHGNPPQDERPLSLGRGDSEGDRSLSEDSAAAAFGAWLPDVPEVEREWTPDEAPCPALTEFLISLGYYARKLYPPAPEISRYKTLEVLEALSWIAARCVSETEPEEGASYTQWLAVMDQSHEHTTTAEWVIEEWREAEAIAAYLDAGEEIGGFDARANTAGRMAAIVVAFCTSVEERELIVEELLKWAAEEEA